MRVSFFDMKHSIPIRALNRFTVLSALAAVFALATAFPSAHASDDAVAPKPSPYAVPWQLRPIMAVKVARLDSVLAFYDDRNNRPGGVASATMLTGGYNLTPQFALFARSGFVGNFPPTGAGAGSLTNPLFAALFSEPLPHNFRIGLFFGLTAPVGMGGGNYPKASVAAANSAGILARSAMDNALFATNYFTAIPGIDLAYIADGWTIQAELTLLQLTRVRGEQVDKDPSRTNITAGLEVGYAIVPEAMAIAELRYQRWLSNKAVFGSANPAVENLSVAAGPRFNIKLDGVTMRPGIAYVQGLAGPMLKQGFTYPTNSYKAVLLDFPFFF